MIALCGVLFFCINIMSSSNLSLAPHKTDHKEMYCFYKETFQDAKEAFTHVSQSPIDNKTFNEDIASRIGKFKEASLPLHNFISDKDPLKLFFIIQSTYINESNIQRIMPNSPSIQDLTNIIAYSEFLKKLFGAIEQHSSIIKMKPQKLAAVNIDTPKKGTHDELDKFVCLSIKLKEEKKHSNELAAQLNHQMKEVATLREQVKKMNEACKGLTKNNKNELDSNNK